MIIALDKIGDSLGSNANKILYCDDAFNDKVSTFARKHLSLASWNIEQYNEHGEAYETKVRNHILLQSLKVKNTTAADEIILILISDRMLHIEAAMQLASSLKIACVHQKASNVEFTSMACHGAYDLQRYMPLTEVQKPSFNHDKMLLDSLPDNADGTPKPLSPRTASWPAVDRYVVPAVRAHCDYASKARSSLSESNACEAQQVPSIPQESPVPRIISSHDNLVIRHKKVHRIREETAELLQERENLGNALIHTLEVIRIQPSRCPQAEDKRTVLHEGERVTFFGDLSEDEFIVPMDYLLAQYRRLTGMRIQHWEWGCHSLKSMIRMLIRPVGRLQCGSTVVGRQVNILIVNAAELRAAALEIGVDASEKPKRVSPPIYGTDEVRGKYSYETGDEATVTRRIQSLISEQEAQGQSSITADQLMNAYRMRFNCMVRPHRWNYRNLRELLEATCGDRIKVVAGSGGPMTIQLRNAWKFNGLIKAPLRGQSNDLNVAMQSLGASKGFESWIHTRASKMVDVLLSDDQDSTTTEKMDSVPDL
eukprot:Clim_evm73s153 gene=Clim_evmTU73s153